MQAKVCISWDLVVFNPYFGYLEPVVGCETEILLEDFCHTPRKAGLEKLVYYHMNNTNFLPNHHAIVINRLKRSHHKEYLYNII